MSFWKLAEGAFMMEEYKWNYGSIDIDIFFLKLFPI